MQDPVAVLPSELVVLIFRKLALQEIVQCMSVCKMWCQFLDGCAVLWCTIDMRNGMYRGQSAKGSGCDKLVTLLGDSANGTSRRRRRGSLLLSSEVQENNDDVRIITDADIDAIARRAGPALSRLSLDFAPHLSDYGMYALIRNNCTSIRHLDLQANQTITTHALEALVMSLRNRLEFLSLRSTEIDDAFVQMLLISTPHLVHLDVSFCRKITKSAFPLVDQLSNIVFTPPADVVALARIIAEQGDTAYSRVLFAADTGSDELLVTRKIDDQTCLPRLKCILATGCGCVGSTAATRIIKVFGKSLEILDVTQSPVAIDVFQHITMCVDWDCADGIEPLKLQTLKLSNMDSNVDIDTMQRAVVPESTAGPEHLWSFQDFALVAPNLTSISLGGKDSCITDGMVVRIAMHYRHLLSLDVHGSTRLSHSGLAALGENCTQLEHVDISECSGCDDRGVVALVGGCTGLKSLNMGGLHISDAGLSAIGDCLRGLEVLLLDSCLFVTSQGIRSMVSKFCESGCRQTLRRLSFSECYGVAADDAAWCREQLRPNTDVTGNSALSFE
ncbi:hypothetical protein H4S06_003146 [Coemansia sp. BCRC 34490]|nr:hypothetical protein H4S06_003146 [Coemansia sp. BCRC 34490]